MAATKYLTENSFYGILESKRKRKEDFYENDEKTDGIVSCFFSRVYACFLRR